jgi:hypothetical protein
MGVQQIVRHRAFAIEPPFVAERIAHQPRAAIDGDEIVADADMRNRLDLVDA